MHNSGVVQHTSLRVTTQTWRHYIGRVDARGLRKVVLASMFTTVALIYIEQLAVWGIFIVIPENAWFTGAAASTLMAATAGAFYLWRIRIPHFVEITIVAIIAAHLVQSAILPAVYLWDISYGEVWYIIAHILYAASLLAGYMLSYVFFTGWRTSHRNKLIAAGVLVVVAVLLAMMRSTYENE